MEFITCDLLDKELKEIKEFATKFSELKGIIPEKEYNKIIHKEIKKIHKYYEKQRKIKSKKK